MKEDNDTNEVLLEKEDELDIPKALEDEKLEIPEESQIYEEKPKGKKKKWKKVVKTTLIVIFIIIYVLTVLRLNIFSIIL